MELYNSVQLMSFLGSVALGACIGCFYDVFRMVRMAKQCSTAAVFLQDILFLLSSGTALFVYIVYYSDGFIRWYILLGAAAGFALYLVSLSPLILGVYRLLLRLLFHCGRLFVKYVLVPILKALQKIKGFWVKAYQKNKAKTKRIANKANFHLKGIGLILYNQCKYKRAKRKKKGGKSGFGT